jgi:hypothetical protein
MDRRWRERRGDRKKLYRRPDESKGEEVNR